MQKITLLLVFSFLHLGLYAQDFEVPKNYKLETAEDFPVYEKDIIRCVDWLMQTPLNTQPEKRKEANAFFIKWLTGSKDVHVEINPKIVNFMKSSPDLLMVFMGGWTKYSLESRDFRNKVAGNLAGIEAVIEFYVKNKDTLPKEKNIEKYIKMKEKGSLEDYINEGVK